MLLSILDDKTFMAGTKTFKVGEELNLSEMTNPVQFPWGQATVAEVNEHLSKLAARLREVRSLLATRLHVSEESYDDEAANLALEYEALERDWLYYSDHFYKAIQNHVGGQLPLARNPETGVVTVRPKQPNETLNLLRDVCAQRVRFHNYESMRHIALHMAGGKVANVAIESELHIETQVPIVSGDYADPSSTPKERPILEWLTETVTATYDKVVRYGPVAGIMWISAAKSEQDPNYNRAYFLNAGSLLRAGQGDPKLALTTALQRCRGKLPTPNVLVFFIYGNMPIIEKEARGVLLTEVYEEGGAYKILTVTKEQKITTSEEGDVETLTVAKEGEEPKLDEAIVTLAREIFAGDKEEKE